MRLKKFLFSSFVLLAASALACLNVAHAATVVISTAAEAEAAGFVQPHENRNHPKPVTGADPAFIDSEGGSQSLQVTLTKQAGGICGSNNTPPCGGFNGVAIKRAGITDDLDTIIGLGTVSFDYFYPDLKDQELVVKVWCVTNGGVSSINYNQITEVTGSWQRASVDLSTAEFRKNGLDSTLAPLASWNADNWCPEPDRGSRYFELGVQLGQWGHEPEVDQPYYVDRFQFGAGADIYDFDIAEDLQFPPDAPTNLVATAGNTEIHVTFDEPDSNGAEITNYEYRLNGGNAVGTGDSSTSITISGLTNGSAYSIQVRAVNSEGPGDWSASVTETPASGAAPPDAPANLSATTSTGSITISFTAGDNNGAAISDYEYSLNNVGWVSLSTASSPATISNLEGGRVYDVTLRAVNSEGPGPDSEVLTVLLPLGEIDLPPTNGVEISFSLIGDTNCSVNPDETFAADGPNPPNGIQNSLDAQVQFLLEACDSGETVTVKLDVGGSGISEGAMLFKVESSGEWVEVTNAVFDDGNNSVTYEITDDTGVAGYVGWDRDSTPGMMFDPVIIAFKIDTDGDGVPDLDDACPNDPTCTYLSVPTLPWPALLTLLGLVGWYGNRRLMS